MNQIKGVQLMSYKDYFIKPDDLLTGDKYKHVQKMSGRLILMSTTLMFIAIISIAAYVIFLISDIRNPMGMGHWWAAIGAVAFICSTIVWLQSNRISRSRAAGS
jgi:magnesium-transporting ATPase (P-type)